MSLPHTFFIGGAGGLKPTVEYFYEYVDRDGVISSQSTSTYSGSLTGSTTYAVQNLYSNSINPFAFVGTLSDQTSSLNGTYGGGFHLAFKVGELPPNKSKLVIAVQAAGAYGPLDDGDGATPSNDGDAFALTLTENDINNLGINLNNYFHISGGNRSQTYGAGAHNSKNNTATPYLKSAYPNSVASNTYTQATYGGNSATDSVVWISEHASVGNHSGYINNWTIVRGGRGSPDFDSGAVQNDGFNGFSSYSSDMLKSRQNGGQVRGRGNHGSVDSHYNYGSLIVPTNGSSVKSLASTYIASALLNLVAGQGGSVTNNGGPALAVVFWI